MSSSKDWENEVLGSIMHFITDERWTTVLLDHLLKQEYLGVDCEGVNLGHLGKVTLVQVATPAGYVFIFDMLQKEVHHGVRTLLQSSVLKIMHDCRADVANLFAEHGILCQQVVDTQLAHLYIETKNVNSTKSMPGLNDLNTKYGLPLNKMKGKIDYSKNQRYWEQRPLTDDMLCYAASDVLSLVHLYPKLKPKIDQPLQFLEICAAKIKDVLFGPSTAATSQQARPLPTSPAQAKAPATSVSFPAKKILLSKTEIIQDKKTAQKVTDALLKEDFIAVDVKAAGNGVLSRKPKLIGVGTESGDVYLFDATSIVVIEFVKILMESTDLIKVMHDCRDAVSILYTHCCMRVERIFDTQIAHRVISGASKSAAKGFIELDKLCEIHNIPALNPYFKDINDPNWFRLRPLTKSGKVIASYDVHILLNLLPFLKTEITDFEKIMSRCTGRIVQSEKLVEDSLNKNEDTNSTS